MAAGTTGHLCIGHCPVVCGAVLGGCEGRTAHCGEGNPYSGDEIWSCRLIFINRFGTSELIIDTSSPRSRQAFQVLLRPVDPVFVVQIRQFEAAVVAEAVVEE